MARKPLKDDEGYLARWDQMTAAEKARVRAKEKAELEAAESERKRPLSSRIVDTLYDKLGRSADAKARFEAAREDMQRRESRYQEAKREASQSDKDRMRTVDGVMLARRYGVDRPVKLFNKGGKVQTSSDTARKLATEMGGMKKGGKPKSGLAVMIAIGETKKPVKKAVGGVGKMRKGMMPEKLAKGGAGKVRKGMMTPAGKIIDVMNKIRGKY